MEWERKRGCKLKSRLIVTYVVGVCVYLWGYSGYLSTKINFLLDTGIAFCFSLLHRMQVRWYAKVLVCVLVCTCASVLVCMCLCVPAVRSRTYHPPGPGYAES